MFCNLMVNIGVAVVIIIIMLQKYIRQEKRFYLFFTFSYIVKQEDKMGIVYFLVKLTTKKGLQRLHSK